MKKKDELSDKQKAFVQEFQVDRNGTQAAIRAGYSKKTAYSIANENLKKPEIAAAIAKAQAAAQERTEITTDFVIAGLLVEAQGKGVDTSPAARVKAFQLIGEHIGMWKKEDKQPAAPVNRPTYVVELPEDVNQQWQAQGNA